jgi:hypothetical protein
MVSAPADAPPLKKKQTAIKAPWLALVPKLEHGLWRVLRKRSTRAWRRAGSGEILVWKMWRIVRGRRGKVEEGGLGGGGGEALNPFQPKYPVRPKEGVRWRVGTACRPSFCLALTILARHTDAVPAVIAAGLHLWGEGLSS